ncbi:ABC-2 type transport system permease protein [Saccharopolyspora lacisalsi]|uniref:ABC-2 type transport system permease protein n=1 Tax=Halosaccharopolyspora lacisalsi TaxID=1000566 RepID=A0A839DWR5_9PSEU|nr:ABC transporter permease subunit [Halosaccharopolyspora lacisalsi]MBA8825954.1 ABC-2 type transport system permease protein [Halosaccharopolyspora lacisalsi]
MRESRTDPLSFEIPTSTSTPDRSDGSAPGYRANRTLPVRVELRRQFTRRRTRLGLGCLAVLPLLLLLAFELGGDDHDSHHTLADTATFGGMNFAAFTLFAATNFLLVVIVALFFGDTVAGEASWSSLRYLLAAPIPRTRLLRQKALAAAVLSCFGLALMVLMALGTGLLWYGGDPLLGSTDEVLGLSAGLLRLGGGCLFLTLHLMWIAGLALWLSVSIDAPLGAVGSAVLVSILSQILDEISALGPLRMLLPTHYSTAWTELLGDEVDWTALANGVFSGLVYGTLFTALALHHFRRKDITG